MSAPTFRLLLAHAILARGIDAADPIVLAWVAVHRPGIEYVMRARGIVATSVRERVAGHVADALAEDLARGVRVVGREGNPLEL